MRQDILQDPATSESAPINETLASAAAAAGAADAVAASSKAGIPPPRQRDNFNGIAPNTTLYVGNLYFEVSEDALQRQFAQFGNIVKTKLVYDHRGLSKGFGYVEFERQEDADAAISAMNQAVFQGRRMAVQYHKRRPNVTRASLTTPRTPNEPSKTLFIGNMSFEMSDKDLNDLFREVRNVVDVRVAIDRRTGQPRGFAHADFIDIDSASTAKRYLESKEVYGRKLRVDFSKSSSGTVPT